MHVYIGEATRHLSTRIEEHLGKNKTSYIFKHLDEHRNCKSLSTPDYFQIIDPAPPKYIYYCLNCFALSLLLSLISFITLLLLLVYNELYYYIIIAICYYGIFVTLISIFRRDFTDKNI